MAATSISHLIWFIVGIFIASSVGLMAIGIVQDLSESMEERGAAYADNLRTQVEIINDPGAVPYNDATGAITVYVKNVGEYQVDTTTVVLVVNGTPLAGTNLTVNLVGNTRWDPGYVATLTGNVTGLNPGIDYTMWVEVNGLDHSGHRSGRDNDRLDSFRIAD